MGEVAHASPEMENALVHLHADCAKLELENGHLADEIVRGRTELSCTRIGRLHGDGGSVEGISKRCESARTHSATRAATLTFSKTPSRPTSSGRGRQGGAKPSVARHSSAPILLAEVAST